MRRILNAALAAFFVFAAVFSMAPARAASRIVIYAGQNPSDVQTNQQARFYRLAWGTWMRDELGANLSAGGVYTDLSVVPNGGMYVAAQPTNTNTLGALYQIAVDDPNPVPSNQNGNQLSADPTKIIVQATQSGPSGAIGPLVAPASGLSQYYLIEAQVQTTDATPQSMLFVSSNGASSYQTVKTQRVDQIVYQLKTGTAAASPTAPAVDSGWIAIATVLVPSGTSTITSGMVSAQPAFAGFVANGSNVTLAGLTLSGSSAGCLQTDTSGAVSSQPCTSGLGTVNGTSPITATTSNGVATVKCTTCVTNVTASGNLSSTGGTTPQVSMTASPSFTNVQSTTQTLSGNSTIGNAGTATSSANYGSLGSFQVESSLWNGTSAALHTWGLSSDTSGNLSFQWDAVPQLTVNSSGNVNILNGDLNIVKGSYSLAGAPVAIGDGNNLLLRPQTSSGGIYFQSSAGVTGFGINPATGVATTGSSSFGPTSLTVAGNITTTGATFQQTSPNPNIVMNATSGNPQISFQLNGTANGAIGSNATGTYILSPGSNPVSIANGISAGSSTYSATGATINGNLTLSPASPTIYANGTYLIGSDGSNTVLRPQITSGHFSFQNTAGSEIASIDSTGNVHGNSFATGSSTYGPTSATVNGPTQSVGCLSGGATPSYCLAGDIATNEGAGKGAVRFGSDAAGELDYGLTASGIFHFNNSVAAGGTISSLSNGGLRITSGTSSASVNGDFIAGLTDGTEGEPYVGCQGLAQNCTLYFFTNGTGSAATAHIDGSGNITATNFIQGSRREWKTHITPFHFDALNLLGSVDYAEYDCKTARCGPTGMHKVGIIANDSPWQVAGKKHNHYDAFAMAAIDGKAITELNARFTLLSHRVDGLEAMVKRLCREKKNRKEAVCRARASH